MVVAAGNHSSPCANATDDEKVYAPGLAWSALTVGNQEDDDDGFWSGDSMAASSDWRNPDFAPAMAGDRCSRDKYHVDRRARR